MNGPEGGVLSLEIGPFNDPAQVVEGVNFVIHYDDDTWDNNNANDYFIPIINEILCEGTPGNLTSTVNGQNSATLSWDAVSGALAYQLQGRRVGGSPVSVLIQNGQTSKTVNGLIQGSTYQWRVRAICSETLRGPYSAVASFSMPSNMFTDASISIWPNPSTNVVNILIRNSDQEQIPVHIFSLDGRMLKSGFADASGQISFDVSDLANGVYLIRSEDNSPVSKYFIVQ